MKMNTILMITIFTLTLSSYALAEGSCSDIQCGDRQFCIVGSNGPECFYKDCSEALCGEHQTCLDDGGVARCVNNTYIARSRSANANTPTCADIQCGPNQICIIAQNGPTCFYRLCSDVQCQTNQVCINNGGVARCINTSAPAATITPTFRATIASTSAPAATIAPTSRATIASTSALTSAPAPTSGRVCSARVGVVARPSAYFVENGLPHQIYDLDVYNTGNVNIVSVTVEIAPASGTNIDSNNKWNLQQSSNRPTSTPRSVVYDVELHGSTVGVSGHYYGAGFFVFGANADSATPIVGSVTVGC